MKKLILLGLSLAAIPILVHATDATITLGNNFLKLPGKYKFILDTKGKLIDKVWTVDVSGGKATIKGAKGVKGKNIEIKGNVISAKIGVLKSKKAKDLKVLALRGNLTGQLGTLGIRKASKKLYSRCWSRFHIRL